MISSPGRRASLRIVGALERVGDFSAFLNKDNLELAQSRVDAAGLAGLVTRIVDNTISGKIAKEVFEAMWAEGKPADAIIEAKGL